MLESVKARFRKEICPFCFEQYSLRHTPFRCVSPPERCIPQPDTVRANIWKQAAPIGRVLPATGSFTKEMRCPACSQRTKRRICPLCHMELPLTTGEFHNMIFAVIGAKDAGKSHYIAVLIEHIKNQIGPSMDFLLEPLNDHTIKRYREHFYEQVYIKRSIIPNTKSARVDPEEQLPLVFSLTFYGKGLLGRRKMTKGVTLVFFDTAGEDLNDQDNMSVVNKYIYRSDGIILLLDPLQLGRVRDQLGPSTAVPEVSTETGEIITRTTSLIHLGRNLPQSEPIPTPLAVAFSKFDAVEPLIDPQFQLNNTPNNDDGFDLADFEAVNSEMQSLVSEWRGNSLLQQVTSRYKEFGFFGLSSLGCNPHGGTTIPRVLPKRVEDPFLWLLYRHGLIKAAKR